VAALLLVLALLVGADEARRRSPFSAAISPPAIVAGLPAAPRVGANSQPRPRISPEQPWWHARRSLIRGAAHWLVGEPGTHEAYKRISPRAAAACRGVRPDRSGAGVREHEDGATRGTWKVIRLCVRPVSGGGPRVLTDRPGRAQGGPSRRGSVVCSRAIARPRDQQFDDLPRHRLYRWLFLVLDLREGVKLR